jgi:hypothetical protein
MRLDTAPIYARLDAISSGPWEHRAAPAADSGETKAEYLADTLRGGHAPLEVVIIDRPVGDIAYTVTAVTGDGPDSAANAEFIANAPLDVRALLIALAQYRAREETVLSLIRVAAATTLDATLGLPQAAADAERSLALSNAIEILKEDSRS